MVSGGRFEVVRERESLREIVGRERIASFLSAGRRKARAGVARVLIK
jgi:hypothetical protein